MFRLDFLRLFPSAPSLFLLGVRVATALVWAVTAAVVVFWGARLVSFAGDRAMPAVALTPVVVTDQDAMARMLGAMVIAQPVLAATPTQAVLRGAVVVGQDGQGGVALIALNGEPAKPYRIGVDVTNGYRLSSLDTTRAVLTADGKAEWTLDMPQDYALTGVARQSPVRQSTAAGVRAAAR